MKKILLLLFLATLFCCFISCKKECVCRGLIDSAFDNGGIAAASFEQSVGKLGSKDCKNWENYSITTRDDERGATFTTTYIECQLQ